MEVRDILSLIALVVAVGGGFWLQFLVKRNFKSLDEKFKSQDEKIDSIKKLADSTDNSHRKVQIDVVRLEEFKKNFDTFRVDVDTRFNQCRADFIRETQILANQLKATHGKIDKIDRGLSKILDKGLEKILANK